MPSTLPANFNSVVVSAHYLSFDEQPVVGTVTFTPSINSLVSPSAAAIILGKTITGKVVDGYLLNESGTAPLRLFATNDPDVSLQGWTYSVKEALTGGAGRPVYDISVPIEATDYGLDLWNLAPAQVVAVPVDQAASVAAVTALSARLSAVENGGPVRVVDYGSGAPPARPSAPLVYWRGAADPRLAGVAAPGDIWINNS